MSRHGADLLELADGLEPKERLQEDAARDAHQRQRDDVPLLLGHLKEFTFAQGTNRVPHGLPHKPNGWMLVTSDALLDLYLEDSSETWLQLSSANVGVAQLWVF